MREQPRREWQPAGEPAGKRKWATPTVRNIELTDDVLRLFGSNEPIADALDACGPNGLSPPRGR